MSILDNPWFVGILGSLLTGIAAKWIFQAIFSERHSHEYAQKVAAVNREVILAIRPDISEGKIPDPEILNVLVSSTCRKYDVAVHDAFNVTQISEELVKELMDSTFISTATKQDYCAKLLTMRTPPPPESESQANVIAGKSAAVESTESLRSNNMLERMSTITGVLVATQTLFVTLFKDLMDDPLLGPFQSLSLPLVILAASFVTMGAVMLARMIMRGALTRAREHEIKAGKRTEARDA